MVGSVIFNRRRNYKIIGQGASTESLLPKTIHDDHSPDQSSGDDDDVAFESGPRHPKKRRDCCFTTVETPNSSRFANHVHSRILQKFPFLVEMFYWALNYVAYSSTKAFASALYAGGGDGVTQLAQDHGIAILRFEHESIFKFLFPIHEADFQAFFLGHQTALTCVNRLYSIVHIPGTVAYV